jgi:hypothetical protein
MVLISHIHKFIYLKNYKVAGSSVESFFGQFCIDPKNKNNYSFQDKQDEQISDYGILGSRIQGSKYTKWYNHISADKIKLLLGDEIFNNYIKFCVIRNPYDIVVSSYFWEKQKCNLTCDFKTYCINLYKNTNDITNLSRLFINNNPVCQYYIRYEHLIDDITNLLEKLGIKDYNISDLPKHKTGFRPLDKTYKDYYDDESKNIVSKIFHKEIEMFNYKF